MSHQINLKEEKNI